MNVEITFHRYINYLRDNSTRLAPLQLIAKLENYLMLEYAGAIPWLTDGKNFALTNLGNYGEQKYDLAVFKGANPQDAVITHLFEAKYFRNHHRWHGYRAEDEILSGMKDLVRQLQQPVADTHYACRLELTSTAQRPYGLIYASYTRKKAEADASGAFFGLIQNRGKEFGLKWFDKPDPKLIEVYADVPVIALETEFFVTLRAGLWRVG